MNTFADVVLARAGDDGFGVVSDDERLTWGEVVQEAADRAAFLSVVRAAGPQVHVGLLLENVPDYLFWTCAAALAGAVVVGINPTRRGRELAGDIRHTDCDLIVTEDRLAGLLGDPDHGGHEDRPAPRGVADVRSRVLAPGPAVGLPSAACGGAGGAGRGVWPARPQCAAARATVA